MESGGTFKDFQAEIEPILKAKGWWGKAIDPQTGEILKAYPNSNRPVEYGSPARLQLIYEQNVQSAFMAGRMQSALQSTKTHPYWMYVAVMDDRTRPAHRALHGVVRRYDDPFWQINMPPNGYRCRCRFTPLTAREVKRRGITVPEPGKIETVQVILPNGEVRDHRRYRSADGKVYAPDIGFDHAPIKFQPLYDRLGQSLTRLPTSMLPTAMSVITQKEGLFAQWRKNPQGDFPLVVLSEEDAQLIGAKDRVGKISAETMAKQDIAHPELTTQEYALAQKTISQGERIQDGVNSLIFILEEGNQVVVVKSTMTGNATFVTSIRRISRTDAKKDRELRRLRGS